MAFEVIKINYKAKKNWINPKTKKLSITNNSDKTTEKKTL
jgi:hypothetical protein